MIFRKVVSYVASFTFSTSELVKSSINPVLQFQTVILEFFSFLQKKLILKPQPQEIKQSRNLRAAIVYVIARLFRQCWTEQSAQKCFLTKNAVHSLYHLKRLLSMIEFVQVNTLLYIANTCKQQRFTINTVHLLYKLAESHIMPGAN